MTKIEEAGLNADRAFFCRLKDQLDSCDGLVRPARSSYYEGEIVECELYGINGCFLGKARFQIEASPGGGFAGQVYRAVPLEGASDTPTGERLPAVVAIKVLRPNTGWKLAFRDWLFRLSFQSTYAPRLRLAALRSVLVWQEILRQAAGRVFGDPQAVARPYGYYWDAEIRSYAEVHEWVESRPVLYHAYGDLFLRSKNPVGTELVGEMQQKKIFMDQMTRLCRAIGAIGLSRQFEWYTLVSQPNVLVRRLSSASGKLSCTAVDCRPGLAVPFFLPLSPVHTRLILSGIRRGRWTHFAEVDLDRLDSYLDAHPSLKGLSVQLRKDEADLKGSLPDIWHRGRDLLSKPVFRRAVARRLIGDWRKMGLLSGRGRSLLASPFRLWLFFGLESLPWIGPRLARLAGNRLYRRHLASVLSSPAYREKAIEAACAADLLSWLAQNRIAVEHARKLFNSAPRYLMEKIGLSWLPAALHRLASDPAVRRQAFHGALVQPFLLMLSPAERENCFHGALAEQMERGVISPLQSQRLQVQMEDRQVKAFLRDFGFTLGLEAFSKTIYLALAAYGLSTQQFWPFLLAALGPVPPSGVVRLGYTLIELAADLPAIISRRDGRLLLSRLAGTLLSPWRWVGNLFAPVQMFGHYPQMSLLLADYWVAGLVKHIPVFGGRGSLLEYALFNLVYNLPISLYRRLVKPGGQQPPNAVEAVSEK